MIKLPDSIVSKYIKSLGIIRFITYIKLVDTCIIV